MCVWLEEILSLNDRRGGVAVKASALQSVDLGSLPVAIHTENFKKGIHILA